MYIYIFKVIGEEAFPITNADLQGFWDMVMLQVVHVDALFKEVDALKANNWVLLDVKTISPLKGVGGSKIRSNINKPKKSSSSSSTVANEELRKQRESQRKRMIEERRKAMKIRNEQQQQQQNGDSSKIEIFVPNNSESS